jgi:hypothetical protein
VQRTISAPKGDVRLIAEGEVASILTKDTLATLYDAPIGTLTDRTTGQTAFYPA